MNPIQPPGRELETLGLSFLPQRGCAAARTKGLASWTVVCLLLLYGYEVFNFSLSIDEEVHAYNPAPWLLWFQQDRWTTGLLTLVLPSFASLPMLSTMLFCAGLGLSANVLAGRLFERPLAQFAFVTFFVCSPLWPHIAEFNQLAWAVGLACVLVAAAILLVDQRRVRTWIWAIPLVAAATGVYQSFWLAFIVLACTLVATCGLGTIPTDATAISWPRTTAQAGISAAGGLILYQVCAVLARRAFNVQVRYVDTWIRIRELVTGQTEPISRTLSRTSDLLSGRDSMFLGYGPVLLAIPALGLALGLVRLLRSGPPPLERLIAAASVAAAFVATFSLVVASGGVIPVRALIPYPALVAFLAGVGGHEVRRIERPFVLAVAGSVLLSAWLAVSLFYSDHLARQRDELLVARLLARIDMVTPTTGEKQVPLVFVGVPPSSSEGMFHRVGTFGASMFEQDGSNPRRIEQYLRLLGVSGLAPRPLREAASDMSEILAMPDWPDPGAVALVHGRVIVKFGPPSSRQQGTLDPALQQTTRSFFSRLTLAKKGDAVARVEITDWGILIHPGDTSPTTAVFRLGQELRSLGLRLEIGPLDAPGLARDDAGTVNVRLLLDGRLVLQMYVDRTVHVNRTFDVTGANELSVVVDNANGKAWWDWFVLSVTSSR